jgi:hypothetical protein
MPFCKTANGDNLSFCSLPFFSSHEDGLIMQVFELSRLFLEKGVVSFHSSGFCMYPCIKPNDLLHIEPRSASQIEVGEIVVYRKLRCLFAHRTISKGRKNREDYITTRADRVKFGSDGEIFDRDLLGVVTCIKRKGKEVKIRKAEFSLLNRFSLKAFMFFYRMKMYFWRNLVNLFIYLQQQKLPRILIKSLFVNSKIEFSLQVPIGRKLNGRLFREASFNELDNYLKGEYGSKKWLLCAKVDSNLIGRWGFVLRPENCPFSGWWLYEAYFKIRYRGTNIEERFIKELDSLLKRLKIKDISVSMFEKMLLKELFFKSFGFKTVSSYKGTILSRESSFETRRAIMKKVIYE